MTFARRRPAAELFLLVVPCRVLALPLVHASTVTTKTGVPPIVIFVSLFFLAVVFLAIKLVYMKHRRIGTIHAPPGAVHSIPQGSQLSPITPGFGFRDKQTNRHRGVLVGCLGSPTWETSLTSKMGRATWGRERASFGYHLRGLTIRSAHSTSARSKSNHSSGSRFAKSMALTSCSRDVDWRILPLSPGPAPHSGGSLKVVHSAQCSTLSPHYGDFSEFHSLQLPGGSVPYVARCASPSLVRLVDGPSHSSQVEYTFLSSLPPNTVMPSPLMGVRDSFQLSRCSLKCSRKPAPPMPPFYLPKGPEIVESQPLQASASLCFSPLASVAKLFYTQQQAVEKVAMSRGPDSDKEKLCPQTSQVQQMSIASVSC